MAKRIDSNILNTLKLDQAYRLAQKYVKEGLVEEAQIVCRDILAIFPKNLRVKSLLKTTLSATTFNEQKISRYPKDKIDQLVLLYNQGLFALVAAQAEKLSQLYRNTFELWHVLGAAYINLARNKEAAESFQNLIRIKPNQPEAHYALGVALQKLGKLDEAIESFTQAIRIKPDYMEALNNRGISFQEQGKPNQAIESYKQAIKIDSGNPFGHNNMGISLQTLGKLNAAIESYQQAIMINPDYAEAHSNLGEVLQKLGKLDEAIVSAERAIKIKPDYAKAYSRLGDILLKMSKYDGAMESYKKAIKIKPDYAIVYHNMGFLLQNQGKLEAAIKNYKKAIELKPDYALAYNNIGNCFQEKGEFDKAVVNLLLSLKLKPNQAGAHYNLGITLEKQGKLDAAIENYEQTIILKPDHVEAHNNLGVSFQNKGEFDKAILSYDQAIKIKPEYAEAHCNRGTSLKMLGKFDSAIESYELAIKVNPNYADAYNYKSLVYLLNGHWKTGFELHEWRLKMTQGYSARPAREQFFWDGIKSLTGKNFYIYEEQGLGDIIQFCRYLTVLERLGAKVSFKVTKKLHALLRSLGGNVTLCVSAPSDSGIDFEAPLMSLPHLLGTSLERTPGFGQYLFAEDTRIESWSRTLVKNSMRIGICWQGSKNQVDFGRSFPLELFQNLSCMPGVELVSLHKGEGEEQIENIDFALTTLNPDFDSGEGIFLDTAAVMMSCDLIITSDTAVAHLAGALGRNTWVALQHVPDWRWLLDRSNSPWYPTLTLYRQSVRGEWKTVFKKIEREVRALLVDKV
jgi:tetratricopeptide (TPR) repeat protein